MKVRSTFRIFALFIALLIFSSQAVFGRGPRLTKPEVDRKQNAVLLIGDHEGINETDAQNAALLVAKALRAQGITVSDSVHETPAGATVYRIVLRRSNENEKILFRLSEEETAGTIIVEREMLLADIEDVVSAGPRLVYALVHQEPLISSPLLMKAGAFTAVALVRNVLASSGVEIGFSFDKLSYAVDIEGRFARKKTEFHLSDRKNYFHFYSFSVGGRYFFMKQNISPYIGGGLGVMSIKYETTVRTEVGFSEFFSVILTSYDYDVHSEAAVGIGAYGVLGVEFPRFARGRSRIEFRVDRPFFRLPSQDVMPITVGVVGGFSF